MKATHNRMTSNEAAEYLNTAPATLANWRSQGKGPAYIKIGKQIEYTPAAVDAWLEEKTVNPGVAA